MEVRMFMLTLDSILDSFFWQEMSDFSYAEFETFIN
jgi:succinate dehydrogenase flavin-adding protein (antitoxin of CptAB toxin-antitoxin module)